MQKWAIELVHYCTFDSCVFSLIPGPLTKEMKEKTAWYPLFVHVWRFQYISVKLFDSRSQLLVDHVPRNMYMYACMCTWPLYMYSTVTVTLKSTCDLRVLLRAHVCSCNVLHHCRVCYTTRKLLWNFVYCSRMYHKLFLHPTVSGESVKKLVDSLKEL